MVKKVENQQSGASKTPFSSPGEEGSKRDWDIENRKILAGIADYLQRGVSDAREKSEIIAQQVNKQAKVLKNLTVLFAVFFTYLQVRQIYAGNTGSQQASKFSAWEMVQNVQDKETSAGLAIALTTLANNCEPLSGLNLKEKYLPGIELTYPDEDLISSFLSRIGEQLFRVQSQSNCHVEKDAKSPKPQLDLRGINFEKSKLQEAKFKDVDLHGASFKSAQLQKAVFGGEGDSTDLEGANLQDADLKDAALVNVMLKGADLSRANLQDANLADAVLVNVMLKGADLRGADLSGTDLSGANLSGADLKQTDIDKAIVAGSLYTGETKFPEGFDPAERKLLLIGEGEDLKNANLSEANLTDANLSGADLSKAMLHNVNLTGVNLIGAKGLEVKQVTMARNWTKAIYDADLCAQFKKQLEQIESCSKDKKVEAPS